MKLAILGDTHFSCRNDSVPFLENHLKFYNEVFFPYLEQNNINEIFQLGDWWDRRKFGNLNILNRVKKEFHDVILKKGWKIHILVGNHDIFHKNSLSVNSPELFLAEYPNVIIHKTPKTLDFDGLPIDVVPWICDENEKEISSFIKQSKSEICFGHFEIAGFEMDRGNVCVEGMDRSFLQKYDMVVSGHFHHKSSDGQIFYVGTPAQITWADADDPRGFHIFDTDKRELKFHKNPYEMFHKIKYDDRNDFTFDSMNNMDLNKYANTCVKILTINKSNPFLFDTFLDRLTKENPIDITIEDYSILESTVTDDEISETEDTPTILKKYVDGLEIDGDKELLYSKLHGLYIEAVNMEQA